MATRVLPVLDTSPARVNAPLSIIKESPEPIMSISPDSAQFSPFIVTLAKPSPSFRPTKLLSSVPVPIRVRVFPVELVEITSPTRTEPVSSTSVLFLLLANIIAAVLPLIVPLFLISNFAVSFTLIPFSVPCTRALLVSLVLPLVAVIASPFVPIIAPLLLIPIPYRVLRPVFPFIIPVLVLIMFTAEEFSPTNMPFSAPIIFPLLLKSPSID